eukprot:COSAG01_NODE_9470_length_2437_cov_98.514970_1_plen_189_part_00
MRCVRAPCDAYERTVYSTVCRVPRQVPCAVCRAILVHVRIVVWLEPRCTAESAKEMTPLRQRSELVAMSYNRHRHVASCHKLRRRGHNVGPWGDRRHRGAGVRSRFDLAPHGACRHRAAAARAGGAACDGCFPRGWPSFHAGWRLYCSFSQTIFHTLLSSCVQSICWRLARTVFVGTGSGYFRPLFWC